MPTAAQKGVPTRPPTPTRMPPASSTGVTPPKMCGQPTVTGGACRNLARSCAANHPTAGVGGGAGGGPPTVPAADPFNPPAPPLPADPNERLALAEGQSTPPEVLAALAVLPDHAVRWEVARNPVTPPETLAGLASDPGPRVRIRVAANANTLPGTLAGLAADPDAGVRWDVARNPVTPTGGPLPGFSTTEPAGQSASRAIRERTWPGSAGLARAARRASGDP